jgi:hypothetical protein
VRTFDGGRTWRDRVRGGPYDTHTALTHPLAPGRIYSAAGDGYFESTDAADSWSSPEDGLKHRYLVVSPTPVSSPSCFSHWARRMIIQNAVRLITPAAGRWKWRFEIGFRG